MFIILLNFSSSLARNQTKYVSLHVETSMIRPIVIDLNPAELIYYTFMLSFDKCNGSCNVLSSKIYIGKETKNINVKVFNMITNKNEAKAIAK